MNQLYQQQMMQRMIPSKQDQAGGKIFTGGNGLNESVEEVYADNNLFYQNLQ